MWLWDLDSKSEIIQVGFPTGGGVANFSPDGQLLAMGSGTTTDIQIFDTERGSLRITLDTESGATSPPEFSPDGRLLLTVGTDIRLWGVPNRN